MLHFKTCKREREMQSEEKYYYQEIAEGSGGFQSGAINRLAMLSLNNNNTTEPPLPSSAATNRCTMCGGGGGGSSSSAKRRSPSSSSLQEPTAKKQLLTLLSPPSSATTTKLSPPTITQIALPSPAPILRRCISDPINSPGTTNAGAQSTQFLNPQSPENPKTIISATTPSPAKSTASLPPLPGALRQSVSDPLSHSPNSGEMGSDSNREGESPSSKRLKRMKDRMREMILWWDQVMREEGEEDEGLQENNNGDGNGNDRSRKTEDEIPVTETVEAETEEAVSVERTGECLILQFKCPCKKGYQILLSGNNCYYKLM